MVNKRTHERNISGLQKHAAEKARVTRERVLIAIDRLVDRGQAINFNSVAKAGEVTKSYLYKEKEIHSRILIHRGQNPKPLLRLVSETSHLDKSRKMLLEAKDRKIHELQEENVRLRDENKRLRGKLYDLI